MTQCFIKWAKNFPLTTAVRNLRMQNREVFRQLHSWTETVVSVCLFVGFCTILFVGLCTILPYSLLASAASTLLPCKFSTYLDDWLTVHRSITLFDLQLDAQNSYLFTYNTFIKILYMFPALPYSSSGGLGRNCIYAASDIVTVCR
jgi:hypothetical protein